MQSGDQARQERLSVYDATDRLISLFREEKLEDFSTPFWWLEGKARDLLAERFPECYEEKKRRIMSQREKWCDENEQRSREEWMKIYKNFARQNGPEPSEQELLEQWESFHVREQRMSATLQEIDKEMIEDLKGDCYVEAFPRIMEMEGQMNLFLLESIGEIPAWDRNKDYIRTALSKLLWAGFYYERYGLPDLAANVWERAYLAAKRIAGYDVEPVFLGILYETMGICLLLLGRKGVRECFERSYEVLSMVHKRMVLTDIAWEVTRKEKGIEYKMEVIDTPLGEVLLPQDVMDQLSPGEERLKQVMLFESLPGEVINMLFDSSDRGSEKVDLSEVTIEASMITDKLVQRIREYLENIDQSKGIEKIHLSPSYDEMVWANEALFEKKLGTSDSLKPNEDFDPQYMSLKRSEFYLEHTKNL